MPESIYLDNAATSFPKPADVYDFIHQFCEANGGNPGRSDSDATMETGELVRRTRTMLCRLFRGDDPNRVTFSHNASDSLNMIIQGMVSRGDHVITSRLEHNSVLRPLYHLEQEGVIEVDYVPFSAAGFVDPAEFRARMRKNTKLVILNHASNVIGTIQPIAEIGGICRKGGVFFAVDATQTAGIIPIDVQAMSIDLLAFTGHKGLLGPTGIGGSYVAEGVPIRPTRFGGTGVDSAARTHKEEFPYRLECGTLNTFGIAGLFAALKWIDAKGLASLHAREMELWDRLRQGLQAIRGVVAYCTGGSKNHSAVLSFNIEGWEAADVGAILDADYGIACRTGLHCAPLVHEGIGTGAHGTVRFSIGPFTTEEQIDAAIAAVRDIAEIQR